MICLDHEAMLCLLPCCAVPLHATVGENKDQVDGRRFHSVGV